MTINPLSHISQMLFAPLGSGSLISGAGNATPGTVTTDNSQLSPFAQLMSTLQQLQQSDPAKYKQVTATLATDLQTAATNAQQNGNTAEANALNQLAATFNQASQSGQLPSFLQQGSQNTGTSGHPHHHHHHGGASALGQDLNSISQTLLTTLDSTGTGTSTSTGTQQ